MDWLLGNAIGNIKLQVPPNRPISPRSSGRNAEKARERRETEKDADDEEGVKCLACGAKISENQARCPSCGWSYAAEENGAERTPRQTQERSENVQPSLSILSSDEASGLLVLSDADHHLDILAGDRIAELAG